MHTRNFRHQQRLVAAAVIAAATLLTGTLSAFAVTSIGTDISTGGTLSVTGDAAFDTNILYVNTATDRVGVLTAAPSSELDVRDSASTPTTNIFQVANLNDSTRYFTVSSTATLVGPGARFTVGSTNTLIVNSSGNFEIVNGVVTRFPDVQGANGQFLTNDGSGNLTWATPVATTTNLNQAYLNATSTSGFADININSTGGAVTIADTFSGTGNIFEIQNRTNAAGNYSTRYFTVSSTAVAINSTSPLGTFHIQHVNTNAGTAFVVRVGSSNVFTIDFQGSTVIDRSLTVSRSGFFATGADASWNAVALSVLPLSSYTLDLVNVKLGSVFKFVILNSGNVGILTSAPTSELDVRDSAPAPLTNIFQVANLNDSTRYFTVSSTSTSIQTGLNVEDGTGSVSADAVTVNTTSGVITDSTDINLSSTRAVITFTNSRITATSVVLLSNCSTPDSGATMVSSIAPGAGTATVTVRNVGVSNQTSDWKLCFQVTN